MIDETGEIHYTAIPHSKRIAKGYTTAMLNSISVEDLDLEKVKCRFGGNVFRTSTANISKRIRDREFESTEGLYKVACCLSKCVIYFDLRCLKEVKGHDPES